MQRAEYATIDHMIASLSGDVDATITEQEIEQLCPQGVEPGCVCCPCQRIRRMSSNFLQTLHSPLGEHEAAFSAEAAPSVDLGQH